MRSSAVVLVVLVSTVITGVCSQDDPYLLVVSPNRIRKLTNIETSLVTSGIVNAVACDYDVARNVFFFSDVRLEFIKRANLDGSGVTSVVTSDISHPDGIAVDWIAKVLYWTDAGTDSIDAADYNGRNRVRLISSGLDEPRAIVLHPVEGWMFWTDWGATPKIERAWMDGTRREAIITSSLGWPNGLTIDFATRKLYWADAELDKIEMSNFDGSSRRSVLTSVPHPFAMTMYGDYIYWTDWQLGAIEKANKVSGSGRTNIATGFSKPMDLHIVSPYRQTGTNCCASNNGGCPSLCLVRPDPLRPICQPEGHVAPCDNTPPKTTPSLVPLGVTSPTEVQIDEGQTRTVQCSTTSPSVPRTELVWSGENMGSVQNTTQPSGSGTISRATMTLTGQRSINNHIYKCTAVYNGHIITSTTTKIKVLFAPKSIDWYSTPSVLEVRENAVLTMKCRATESSPPGTPRWKKLHNGVTTTETTTSSRLLSGSYGGQIVETRRDVTPSRSDDGVLYWCEVDYTYLSGSHIQRKSTQKQLHVLYPVTTKLVVQTPVKEGSRMLLTCQTSGGYPTVPQSYQWSYDGQIISGENGKFYSGHEGGSRVTFGGTASWGLPFWTIDFDGAPLCFMPWCSMEGHFHFVQRELLPISNNARTLERNPVSRTESGRYSCTATNRGGVSTAPLEIDVYYPPEVELKIIPASIKEGDHVVMTCSTTGGNPVHVLTYSWKNGDHLMDDEHGQTLVRSPFSRNQAGVYECTATNQGGKKTSSKRIEVMYPPDVSITRNIDPVKEGEDLYLTCQVTGGNPATVTSYVWTHNAQILNGENGRGLKLPAINRRESGDYVCTIRTPGGTATALKTITVMYPPTVMVTLSPAVVVEGTRAVLTCQAVQTGTSLTYTWSLDSVEITGQKGRTLVRNPVKRQDSGVYECSVETVGGSESGQKILDVLYKPELDANKEQVMSVARGVGQEVTYTVYVKAKPPTVTVTCSKNESDSRLMPRVRGLMVTMTMSVVHVDDYGVHNCRVTNAAGSEDIQLTLLQKDVETTTAGNVVVVPGDPDDNVNPSSQKNAIIGGAAGGIVFIIIIIVVVVTAVLLVRRHRAPYHGSGRCPSEQAFVNRRMSELNDPAIHPPSPDGSPFDNPSYVSDYETAVRPKLPYPDDNIVPRVPSWDPSLYEESIYSEVTK